MEAADRGHVRVVELLIAAGAHVASKNDFKYWPTLRRDAIAARRRVW